MLGIHADLTIFNLLIHRGETRVLDFDDCGLGWYLYDLGAAMTFLDRRPEAPELISAWVESYREVRPLPAADEAEIPTFVMLRRLLVLAWLGSHVETALAQEVIPGYAAGTCQLARKYLKAFG